MPAPLLLLKDIAIRFGNTQLLDGAELSVGEGERLCLVGRNGSGKSTLLKIAAGLIEPDAGSRFAQPGATIRYLPQEPSLAGFATTRDYVEAGLGEGYDSNRTFYLLGKLGLTGAEIPATLSGGEARRAALARALAPAPDILLLDEPTNHLDLETRNWLEGYLTSYPFGYILISHDRYFLDVTIDRTVEIWNKRLNLYQGNYTKYLKQKDERREQLMASFRNQRDRIEHLEAFINRFRYQATKAKQVQSRIKELEKIERIEVPEEEPVIHFKFPQPPPSGRIVAQAEGLGKSYGPKQVFSGARFTIERGDRVALVGVNGAGKSTLIKLLTGQETPTAGSIRLGHNVVAEYFAQDQYKVLDPEARMLDDINRSAARVPELQLRSLLGCFLFSGDDVFKPLGVLSGGERNRYALARILVSPANFLLLDEPTNHLDMRAKDVLLEALANYSGTVVFVSHDRYFIDRLATRVIEIEGGAVTPYEGNYEDYLRRKSALSAPSPERGSISSAARLPHPSRSEVWEASQPAQAASTNTILIEGGYDGPENPEPKKQARRLNPIKQKQMRDRCAFLEEEIPRIESGIAHTDEELAVYVSAAETERLTTLARELRGQLAALTAEWEDLTEQLEGE
jgi:ATP-binding cassette, subfamily F, member 3